MFVFNFRFKSLDYLGNSIDVTCDITHIAVTLRSVGVPLDAVLSNKADKHRLHVDETLNFDRQPLTLMDATSCASVVTVAMATGVTTILTVVGLYLVF